MEPISYDFAPPPLPAPRPPQQSDDGRWRLTDDELTLEGRTYSLLELERVGVQPVRWLLWIMVGALVLGGFTLAFLQDWIRTPTAMLGMSVGALLLAWGRRGAVRVRLHRLGLQDAHHALSGELGPWQKLAAETNLRIHLRHQRAAAEAMALLAAQAAATRPPGPPKPNRRLPTKCSKRGNAAACRRMRLVPYLCAPRLPGLFLFLVVATS